VREKKTNEMVVVFLQRLSSARQII